MTTNSKLFLTLTASIVITASGCPTVRPVILDRKTALENQILGTFQRLDSELILASSVRGDQATAKLSPLQREALQAMLNREFNRDDIDALKAKQIVGEANDGTLKLLTSATDAATEQARALVEAENRDRMIIMRRVIQIERRLGDKDLTLVRRVFAGLMLRTAQPGHRVQLRSGAWDTVTKQMVESLKGAPAKKAPKKEQPSKSNKKSESSK